MSHRKPLVFLTIGLMIVAAAYFPGLLGGFLLDDHSNLSVLRQWLDGSVLWQQIVFFNSSGPLGRPLSMATFMGNAALGGMTPFGFKLTNLLIHLLCAVMATGFLNALLKNDPHIRNRALLVAMLLAFWWAVLPIHVSTVLYIVQRMAQLSVLFMFAGLWCYVAARHRIRAREVSGDLLLWLGVPALTVAATLSKENGLLLPLLCLAVELGYFSRDGTPRSVKLFFLLLVGLPAVGFAMLLLWKPDVFFAGYVKRPFTLYERLLTQPIILWEYVRQILVPFGPGLGLFHDTYQHSTGLLSPVTTLLSIIAWVGAVVVAWIARAAAPAILTGLLIYFFGHAMESGIFPLELVFLHRNYGPSLGILLAFAGTVSLIARKLPSATPLFRRVLPLLAGAFALVLVGAVYARANVWQSQDRLIAQELASHPNTVRTRLVAATYALQHGHPSAALHQVDAIQEFGGPADLGTVSLFKLVIYYCEAGAVPEEDVLSQFESPPPYIHTYALRAFELLTRRLEEGTCQALEPEELIPGAIAWLDATRQPVTARLVWRFRYDLARLVALTGNYPEAQKHAMKAFRDSKHEFPLGMLAFQLSVALGDLDTARTVFEKLETHSESPDLNKRLVIRAFRDYLESPDDMDPADLPRAQLGENPLSE